MFNNVGAYPFDAQYSYHSEANDPSSTSSEGSQSGRRSASDQFGGLTPRSRAVSEFGSAASEALMGDVRSNPQRYYDQTYYSNWAAGRTPSSNSSGWYGDADNRSFGERSSTDSQAWVPSPAPSRQPSNLGQALSEAGSGRSSSGHIPPSPLSSTTVSSLSHEALSEAGSGSGRWSPNGSGVDSNSHQNRLPSLSDGSGSRSLTDSEIEALRGARESGRLRSGNSELGSAISGWNHVDAGPSGYGGEPMRSANRSGRLSTIAEDLSDAGSNSSAERAAMLERLSRAREGISVPPEMVSPHLRRGWAHDTEVSVSDIPQSTAVTQGGPPTRRAPSAPSSQASSTVSMPRGPAIYGRQPPLRRMFGAVKSRLGGSSIR
jgi:hypothetical protein